MMVAIVGLTALTHPTFAATALQNPLKFDDLVSVLMAIVQVLVILAVPIIIFFIVYAGFLYVTAQGNPQKIKTANNALLYAVLGGVIVLGATVLGAVVCQTVKSFSTTTVDCSMF